MSKWLQRALSAQDDAVPKSPKLPKYNSGAALHTKGAVHATPETPNEIDVQERAAIAEQDGGVPARFALAFGLMYAEEPSNPDAINDAGVFLDQWGWRAERLGWTAGDLFGRDPRGLVRMLNGRGVVALSGSIAGLSDGTRYVRGG